MDVEEEMIGEPELMTMSYKDLLRLCQENDLQPSKRLSKSDLIDWLLDRFVPEEELDLEDDIDYELRMEENRQRGLPEE